MAGDDWVNLCVVIKGCGPMYVGTMRRQQASDQIRIWYEHRSIAMGTATPVPGVDHEKLAETKGKSVQWLRAATVAINGIDAENGDWCMSAWAVSEVVGMYHTGVPAPKGD